MAVSNAGHGTGQFDPGTVRMVDFNSINQNVLVRGGTAFGADNFSIDKLITAIQADQNYSSLHFPVTSTFQIIDFCLIGFGPTNHKDKEIVDNELTYFTTTPPQINGDSGPYPTLISTQGNSNLMVYWPILAIGGTVPCTAGDNWDSANDVNLSITNDTKGSIIGYNFAGLVPAIYAALNNQSSLNPTIKEAIIYVHCDSGVNRTGAAVTGYLMSYGSNISAIGLKPLESGSYELATVQNILGNVSPTDDSTPPGGSDQPVAEAFCNYIHSSTGNPRAKLASQCVPNANTVPCNPTTKI